MKGKSEKTDRRSDKSGVLAYYPTHIYAAPLAWFKGRVATIHCDGDGTLSYDGNFPVYGYVLDPDNWEEMTAGDLPVEFFNHQIRNADTDSEDAVRAFVEQWGFPFLQVRDKLNLWSVEQQSEGGLAWLPGFDAAYRDALAQTEKVETFAFDASEERRLELIEGGKAGAWSNDPFSAISLAEVRVSIRLLQAVVGDFYRAIVEDVSPNWKAVRYVNASASRDSGLGFSSKDGYSSGGYMPHLVQPFYGGLTSEVCNQIISSFADGKPWKQCACEGCGTLFKVKQSKSQRPYPNSVYCCDACEQRQRKRNQRHSGKNRIQH